MRICIEIDDRHVELCQTFASFRRTLTTSYRLIEDMGGEDLIDSNLEELMEIIPAIEALQFAVRDGARGVPRLKKD